MVDNKYNRVIVVLGGADKDFEGRFEKGLAEYYADRRSVLLVSGQNIGNPRNYVRSGRGLDSVLVETDSFNTEDNAINSFRIINERLPNAKEITVISDYAHLLRTKLFFSRHKKGDYQMDFQGVKTRDRFHRIAYELMALPLAFLPYRYNQKLTAVYRNRGWH